MTDKATAAIRIASQLMDRELLALKVFTAGQHATTVLVTDGVQEFVVREFPAFDEAAVREAEILQRLRPLDALVPRLAGVSHDLERPVIVTTFVPGSTPDLSLSLETMAAHMATALVKIHALDGTGLRTIPVSPPAGESGIALAAQRDWGSLDMSEPVLTHSDFWGGNALWDGDELTGVVDWSGARLGPRGVDLAWCRQDLMLLGSVSAAEHFLSQYERHLGRNVPDIRAWDIQAAARAHTAVETWLPNYLGIGRTDMTEKLLRKRLDDWSASLLG